MGAWLVVLPACRRAPVARGEPPQPAPAASGSSPANAPVPPNGSAPHLLAAASSSAAPPAAAERDADVPEPGTVQRAVGAARRLVKEGRYSAALDAFDPALSGSTPDARALSERGFVRMRYIPSSDDDAYDDFWFASAGRGDAAAHAEAWYNLGQLETRRGKLEAARAAYARSVALNATTAATSALAKRVACVAEVEREGGLDASLVNGWSEVCRAIGRCDGDTSEAEARGRSCVTTSYSAAEPDISHGCKSAPPWTSSHDYSFYNWREDFIVPAAHAKFLVLSAFVGGWPAHFQSQRSVTYELHDKIVQARFEQSDLKAAPGHQDDGIGWSSPTKETYSFFDVDSGALLAVVSVLADDEVTLHLDARKRIVQLDGRTCGGSVALDGNARYLP